MRSRLNLAKICLSAPAFALLPRNARPVFLQYAPRAFLLLPPEQLRWLGTTMATVATCSTTAVPSLFRLACAEASKRRDPSLTDEDILW